MSLWGTNALRWALYSCTLEIPIWYLSVKKIFQEQRKKRRKIGKVEMKVNIWRGIQLKNFFLSPFFSLVFFISFSLLYFRSRSCNGFTTLCFLLIVIFLDMNGFDKYFQFMGLIFFLLIGNNQSEPAMMSSQFPVKVWAIIFSYLDFRTLQKKTTLVCKHWHEMIRNDPTLSGHLALHPPLKPPDQRWTSFVYMYLSPIFSH